MRSLLPSLLALAALAGCHRSLEPVTYDDVDRCNAAMGTAKSAGEISRACAPLYDRDECRNAMLHFDERPIESRAITVAQACASAYCPSLAEPKPKLCTLPAPGPTELPRWWAELNQAILEKHLGPELWKHYHEGALGAAKLRLQQRTVDGVLH